MNKKQLTLTDYCILGFIAACLVWIGVILSSSIANAANASNKKTIGFGGDRLYNYDFLSKNQYYGSPKNVDWAVTLLFTNNAKVNKVKNYYWDTEYCGSSKYGRFRDSGSSYEWDSDRGAKSRCTLLGDAYHMRVYGDEDDRMYNTQFGYWVFATTHIDHDENLRSEWFGESEKAQTYWHNWATSKGWLYYGDWNMQNNEPYRAEGNHRWNNDQYASIIMIP